MIERLRKGLATEAGEAASKQSLTAKSVIDRLRKVLPTGIGRAETPAEDESRSSSSATKDIPPLRANDLRHYLSQRIGAKLPESGKDDVAADVPPAPKVGNGKIGPALKSLDAVLNHVIASAKGNAPRALLVAGVTPKVDATAEAIEIARALVARREQVVLVDLTRSAAAVSGRLGLPRAPGFTDLAAGRVRFDQVVKIDEATPLQVIAAGNPTLKGSGDDPDRFMRVFDALTQAYDSVVLHGDPEVVRVLKPALKFELPAVVAVLPAGASAKSEAAELGDLAGLGCPVVVYEQEGKGPRAGMLGRAAAI
jgi:Mrp family chromosome partitioning ATPase